MGRVGDVEIVQGQLELTGFELNPRAIAIAEMVLRIGQRVVDYPERVRREWVRREQVRREWVRGKAPGADSNDGCG